MAALSSACGVAVEMDYGSDGSGAPLYAVQEALVERFGYYSADMFDALTDAGLVALQENMINGLPALLSFSPPDGWGGHVVVCDGYNTDGEYHLNFGWGSDQPRRRSPRPGIACPTALLYRDCVITECILNVQAAQAGGGGGLDVAELLRRSGRAIAVSDPSHPEQCRQSARGVHHLSGRVPHRSRGQGYANRLDSFTIEPLRQGAFINVAFKPAQAGDYYGTLVIRYGDGEARNVILKGWAYEQRDHHRGRGRVGDLVPRQVPVLRDGRRPNPQERATGDRAGRQGAVHAGRYGLTVGPEREADRPGQRGAADRADRVEPRDGLGRPAIRELGLRRCSELLPDQLCEEETRD